MFGNIFVKPGLLLIVSVLFKVPVRLCEVVKHLTYHRFANLLMKSAYGWACVTYTFIN